MLRRSCGAPIQPRPGCAASIRYWTCRQMINCPRSSGWSGIRSILCRRRQDSSVDGADQFVQLRVRGAPGSQPNQLRSWSSTMRLCDDGTLHSTVVFSAGFTSAGCQPCPAPTVLAPGMYLYLITRHEDYPVRVLTCSGSLLSLGRSHCCSKDMAEPRRLRQPAHAVRYPEEAPAAIFHYCQGLLPGSRHCLSMHHRPLQSACAMSSPHHWELPPHHRCVPYRIESFCVSLRSSSRLPGSEVVGFGLL